MTTRVLISGGFDPLHSGHVSYINAAKKLGDSLIVAVNSDDWLVRKKGQAFLSFAERCEIIRNLREVDQVIGFDDTDGSATQAILKARLEYPADRIVFANGGDRTEKNIPEQSITDVNLEFVFGVGGNDKKNSSSWILAEWKAAKTPRSWGYYRVLHDPRPGVKVKELTVDPHNQLSMQRHQLRSEFWFVSEGVADVNTLDDSGKEYCLAKLHQNQSTFIQVNQWHRLCNNTDSPVKVIEIQYGDRCEESDIERL
jgi:D-beta-D-heptose 7-phosphate kinase/D-beta-D-heptose 1-phosphate adenosyltransferase